MTQTEAQNQYEVLKINPDYEINKNYPYAIRRISTGRVLTPCSSYNQYINVIIGGRTYGLHKVIATQWIENPNNLKEVNHKDNDRTNYHLENLEWVSHSDNLKRRSKKDSDTISTGLIMIPKTFISSLRTIELESFSQATIEVNHK